MLENGELVGVDCEVVDLREGPEVAPFMVVHPLRTQRPCRGNQTCQDEVENRRYEEMHDGQPSISYDDVNKATEQGSYLTG